MSTAAATTFAPDQVILNNASNSPVFTFNVSGTVQSGTMLPAPVVIDNGPGVTGFASSGMTYVTTSGYKGDVQYTRGDNTGDNATWTFTGLPSGTYLISTNWVKGTSRATNAPYTLTGLAGGSQTVTKNQQLTPADLTWDGVPWSHLGQFQITGGTLTVKLTDSANGYVYADAVRVEQLSPLLAGEFGAGLPTSPEGATAGLLFAAMPA
jgi:hypothetical protein